MEPGLNDNEIMVKAKNINGTNNGQNPILNNVTSSENYDEIFKGIHLNKL